MDRDDLEPEVRDWVEDDVVSESQAEEILARYEPGGSTEYSRVVTALSLAGVALVVAGVLVFVGVIWDDLPLPGQLLLLAVTPPAVVAFGWWLRAADVGYPRVGEAVVLLGAFCIGVSLALAVDVLELDAAEPHVLLAWTLLAAPVAYGVRSKAVALLSLAVFGGWLVEGAGDEAVLALVFYGVAVYAAHELHERYLPEHGFESTHRLFGVFAVAAAGFLAAVSGVERGGLELQAVVYATAAVAAAAAVYYSFEWWRSDDGEQSTLYEAVWVDAVVLYAVAAPVFVAAPVVAVDAGAVLVYAGYLAVVLLTVLLGYYTRSQRVVDVGGAFFLLFVAYLYLRTVVSFGDVVLQIAAFVLGGVLLIVGGGYLERKRRRLMEEMGEGDGEDEE